MEEKTMGFEEVLDQCGCLVWRTSGVSMRPLIKEGRDIVMITVPEGRPEKYDVVFFKAGDKYILHRVIKVCDGYLITAGDNNDFREKVKDADLIGVMTGLKRKGKDVDLGGRGYRFYSRVWGGNYVLRCITVKPLRTLRRLAAKAYRRIKRVR